MHSGAGVLCSSSGHGAAVPRENYHSEQSSARMEAAVPTRRHQIQSESASSHYSRTLFLRRACPTESAGKCTTDKYRIGECRPDIEQRDCTAWKTKERKKSISVSLIVGNPHPFQAKTASCDKT